MTLALVSPAFAGTVFSTDFEGLLDEWTGQDQGAFSGIIVADPLEADSALTFEELASGGDVFTIEEFAAGEYILEFDYLGLPISGSVDGNLGGTIGISDEFPGEHRWLQGTSLNGGIRNDDLIDDGLWHHYVVPFESSYDFHIVIEDWSGAGRRRRRRVLRQHRAHHGARTVVPRRARARGPRREPPTPLTEASEWA